MLTLLSPNCCIYIWGERWTAVFVYLAGWLISLACYTTVLCNSKVFCVYLDGLEASEMYQQGAS